MNDTRSHAPYPSPPAGSPPPLGDRIPRDRHPEPTVLRRIFTDMLRSRLVEERIVDLYRLGKITGGCYTGIGNEATSVGCASALEKDDVLVPTHRDMGAHIARGHVLEDIMRQYLKKGTSMSGGKDSGLHLGREGTNIIGMISHLAHMLPVAVGIALAARQENKDAAVLATVGDGSTSLGDFHESLNFAAVQKLPVLFVIENNQYAYSTPVTLQYAAERLSDRAQGYGMKGARIDGTDAIETWSSAREAFARGRSGEGPTLLECVTMRMRGHSEHDDFKYVPATLLDAWRPWDPIVRLERHLVDQGVLAGAAIKALRAEIGSAIDRAVEIAENDPAPDPGTADKDVFRLWRDEWTAR